MVANDGVSGMRIGVVQALANHDPDVDAIYRLTFPPGGLPFSFGPGSPATEGRPLRGVPAGSMAPYNAQVSSSQLLLVWSANAKHLEQRERVGAMCESVFLT